MSIFKVLWYNIRYRACFKEVNFMRDLKGFTLAEVLITIGVIGVVAAMTIPTLIQSYRNRIVETRLQKVYSIMNQAIQRAEADYGAKELWDYADPDFWDKYFAPYIKVLKTETVENGSTYNIIYFPDGSIIAKKIDGSEYFYYPNGKNFNIKSLNETKKINTGITLFTFRFNPTTEFTNKVNEKNPHYRKGFMPYAYHWNGTVADLKEGFYPCKENGNRTPNFCTMYIMQNGWKIPKDYPFKVK